MSQQQPRWRQILEQHNPPQQPRWRKILEQARTDAARQDAEEVAAINRLWGCQDPARTDANKAL